MKHPHHDMIVEWAKDTSKVVQWRREGRGWKDVTDSNCLWIVYNEYRFKPEPKPDVVRYFTTGVGATVISHLPNSSSNLRLVFSGETGELIDAQVI